MTKANIKTEFGAAVRAHRQRLGISQETLAERAALHRTYVTDVERGARNLSLESISRLAHALDLSISSLFSRVRSQRSGRGVASETAQHITDILLVEDDSKDIELTLAAFAVARLSNRVEVVRDGPAALDFLLGQGDPTHGRQLNRPLVVLLDLHLPKLHGLEVLRRLRAEERTRTLQVVVLTNSRQDADLREALRLGANAYIVKPLNFEALSAITPQLNFSWVLLYPSEPLTHATAVRRTNLKT
jgi:CheY-like chemotaxis protein